MSVMDTINWLEDVDEARRLSTGSGKPVLMFFHYEHCNGCKRTINETLPKMSVIEAVNQDFIPVMLDTEVAKDLVSSYRIDWTPTFIVTDSSGMETDRWVGYLPEDDYLSELNMALARYAFRMGSYKDAERRYDEVVIKYPFTDLAPEACYFIGVSRYRYTGEASWLTHAYNTLKDMYPDSTWTIKASAWSAEQLKKAA
jgi:thioredoxin-related protein